jgi:hypothetical protein
MAWVIWSGVDWRNAAIPASIAPRAGAGKRRDSTHQAPPLAAAKSAAPAAPISTRRRGVSRVGGGADEGEAMSAGGGSPRPESRGSAASSRNPIFGIVSTRKGGGSNWRARPRSWAITLLIASSLTIRPSQHSSTSSLRVTVRPSARSSTSSACITWGATRCSAAPSETSPREGLRCTPPSVQSGSCARLIFVDCRGEPSAGLLPIDDITARAGLNRDAENRGPSAWSSVAFGAVGSALRIKRRLTSIAAAGLSA